MGAESEPLETWLREGPAEPGVRRLRFEFSSRGDRVPGLLLLPATPRGALPLVLLQHGAGGSKHSEYLEAARLPWVRAGAAVASIDFPLHGERASAKLSELVLGALTTRDAETGTPVARLFGDFAGQAALDLRRALDALVALPEIDSRRIAYVGFSMGAILGGLFCPSEPRLRAAALALGGAGLGPPSYDPAGTIGGFAPRPLLLVNATRDARIPVVAAEALYAAAAEPKQIIWFESGHSDLPGLALKAIWHFLARELAIA